MSSGRWRFSQNKFWTTSYDYAAMSAVDPNLHSELSKASLIIFKVK